MMLKTPLSRAEYDILRLADQPIGYDPYEDGPWWVRLLQPFAFSVIRGLRRVDIHLRAMRLAAR
jgi:hypothetical protein